MFRSALVTTILLWFASSQIAAAQTFSDVPASHWAHSQVEILAANGITAGCGNGNYCPEDSVNRAQMAVFLERSMNGSDYVPPAASGNVFLDVGAGDFAANFIEQLYNDGITAGCGNNNYCPDAGVSRAQMAVFLLRAKYGSGYSPSAATGVFSDVDLGYWAASWIEALAAEGITAGCGNGSFCPEEAVTRAQMAVFLVRTFDLSLIPVPPRLTLTGVASDVALAGANITARVFVAGSSGSSWNDFVSMADANGAFSVEIDAQHANDFVVVQADGVDGNIGIRLVSLLGSAGSLDGRAVDSTIDVSNYGALEISPASTSMAVLAERIHGGQIFDDSALDSGQRRILSPDFLQMASAIKTFIDNPQISLPAGTANTLELVSNLVTYADLLALLESSYPDQLQLATESIPDSLTLGFSPDSLPGTTYLANLQEHPYAVLVYELVRNTDGTGGVVMSNGDASATWAIGFGGEIIIDLENSPVTEQLVPNPGPTGPFPWVTGRSHVDRLTIRRIGEGVNSQQLLVLRRVVTEYPENPELQTEVVTDGVTDRNLFVGIASDQVLPLTSDDLTGRKMATSYFHQENNALTTWYHPEVGSDVLTFNANGTGITSRRLLTFVWSIDPQGAAIIRFANGDENKLAMYASENLVNRLFVVGDLADGRRMANGGHLIPQDPSVSFSEALLTNRRYRAVQSIFAPYYILDFLFFPNGEGCKESNWSDGSSEVEVTGWTATAGELMDLFRYNPSFPDTPYWRRNWELIGIETGQFGDRYWVVETVEKGVLGDPSYPFADPAISPGRINAYEFIQDLAGQPNPCIPPP